jgi:hypothetical protein
MQLRGVEVRKRRAQEREEERRQDALTVRQRIAVAIQKRYTVAEWLRLLDGLKAEKASVEVKALAQLMNQSFGAPQDAEADESEDPIYGGLTREQRAVMREHLLQVEEDGENDD